MPWRVMHSHAKPLVPALRTEGVGRAETSLRILLLSQYFPPEIGATQSRMQAFAEHLAARGHEVTVICEFPNHPHGVIPSDYRGHVYEDDRSNPYRVLRVWVKASEEKTQRTRMAFYLSYMALATAMAPVAGRVDVVVATTPPLFTGAAGLALARLNRAPFVLDVRDLWPSAAVSLNQIPSQAAIRASGALERALYRQAAVVTAVTKPFCDHIDSIRRHGPQTVLLPNGTLELFFEDVDPEDARQRLGARDGASLVTFAGTLGIAQALPTVLDAARLSGDGVQWALVGDGPMRSLLLQGVKKRSLTNLHFHPQVPLEQVPPLLASSDALLVTLAAHPTFTAFVPSKLIDFMAVGKPVLLAAAGESARLLESAGGGISVAPEDPQALADAARWIASHPEEAAAMGRRGRAFARGRLRGVQAARLERLLVDLARR
jgi:glycosyltransferase involved in cell wall biosynthesis